MNIFKKMAAAIYGWGKRKVINFNAVNDVPAAGTSLNASRSGRSTFSWGKNGKQYRTKMQAYEINRNRWKSGGTGSWSKSHAGKTENNRGRQLPALTLIPKAEKSLRKLARLNNRVDNLEHQLKARAVMGK